MVDKDYDDFVERMGSFEMNFDIEEQPPEQKTVEPETIQHGETFIKNLNSKRR